MKINKLSIFFAIILALQVILVFTFLPQIKTKIQIERTRQYFLKTQHDKLLIERNEIKEEYATKFLKDNFDNIEIRDICKSQITTYIEINGEVIRGGNPKITLNRNTAKIKIVEQYNDLRLPIETVKTGGILNNINLGNEPVNIYSTLSDIKKSNFKKTNRTYIEYEIENINPGEIITIHITQRELLDRLELERGVLEVIYAGE